MTKTLDTILTVVAVSALVAGFLAIPAWIVSEVNATCGTAVPPSFGLMAGVLMLAILGGSLVERRTHGDQTQQRGRGHRGVRPGHRDD